MVAPLSMIKKIDCKDSKIIPNIPLSIGYRRINASILYYVFANWLMMYMFRKPNTNCFYIGDI